MPKSGQAQVLTAEQQRQLFQAIQNHRHAEKNIAIMKLSFKLGLRAQEIALLQIKDAAKVNATNTNFKLLEVLSLSATHTQGANAMKPSKGRYQRKTISFNVDSFNKVIKKIENLIKSGEKINPEDFYPAATKHPSKPRDLPIIDVNLRAALSNYLEYRLEKGEKLKPSTSFFVTQKGEPYSPNTLQEHMALMLRNWAGIEKASSHSGRRSFIENPVQKQNKS